MSSASESLDWRSLSVVDDGDEVLLGDRRIGSFVAVPPVGGTVIRALQAGATVDQATAVAEDLAGEPVDVRLFLEELQTLGIVGAEAVGPVRSAPIQQRRWVYGPGRARARPMFATPAWILYGVAFAFSVGCLVLRPDLWPSPHDVFIVDDVGASALLLMVMNLAGAALHEGWHWLAARAAGVPARFGVDRRWNFLVVETDLSQVWTLQRRQRYGPLLAGMAVDSTVLAVLLASQVTARIGMWEPPELVARVTAAVVFLVVSGMAWQFLVFFRTDLYAVLVVATGCRNLWRVKTLLLRRAVGRLTPEEAIELVGASARDLHVGRWFRWVWLIGFAAVVGWFVLFSLPILVTLLSWIGAGLGAGPGHLRFWSAVACIPLVLTARLTVLGLVLRDLRQRLFEAKRPQHLPEARNSRS